MDIHAQEKTDQNVVDANLLQEENAKLRQENEGLQAQLSLALDKIATLEKSNAGMKAILDSLGKKAAAQAKIPFVGDDFIEEEVDAEHSSVGTDTN